MAKGERKIIVRDNAGKGIKHVAFEREDGRFYLACQPAKVYPYVGYKYSEVEGAALVTCGRCK